jgi:hypothetical protein
VLLQSLRSINPFSYFQTHEVCFAINKPSPNLKLLLYIYIYAHFACFTWQRTHLFFLYFTFCLFSVAYSHGVHCCTFYII